MKGKSITSLWSIDLVTGTRAKHFGIVKAKTKGSALKIAQERFSIRPRHRDQIVITKLDDD
jgi:hypothetical protein